ncbi:MAG: helix-turn-helix domain-containing protein [Nostoc sp.]|uniref:helix-turn-helix domain-containing protein n=1 Tax=Nostoc sp. TaxID=1180 RepID=UPI002FFD2C54
MPVSYSGDLRSRVITEDVAKEGSQRQLAERFKVSLSFVRNLLRRYRQNGQIEAKRRGGYQQPAIQIEIEFSRQEINYFISYFYGYLEGYFQSKRLLIQHFA